MDPIIVKNYDGPAIKRTEAEITETFNKRWDHITVKDSHDEATIFYQATITGMSQGLYDIDARRQHKLRVGYNINREDFDNLWR